MLRPLRSQHGRCEENGRRGSGLDPASGKAGLAQGLPRSLTRPRKEELRHPQSPFFSLL